MAQKFSSALTRYNYIEGSIDEQYHQIASRFGLSDSAFSILYALEQEGDGCLQTVLYKYSGMSRKTAGSSLQKLQEDGLIIVRRNQGRGNCVFLTQKGRAFVSQTIVPIIQAENAVFEAWKPEERELFLTLSRRYLDQISEAFAAMKPPVPDATAQGASSQIWTGRRSSGLPHQDQDSAAHTGLTRNN